MLLSLRALFKPATPCVDVMRTELMMCFEKGERRSIVYMPREVVLGSS